MVQLSKAEARAAAIGIHASRQAGSRSLHFIHTFVPLYKEDPLLHKVCQCYLMAGMLELAGLISAVLLVDPATESFISSRCMA